MKSNNIIGRFRIHLLDLVRGTKIFQVLNELRHQQYLSKDELNEIRTKRFNHLFKLAQTTTTFYKNVDSYEKLEVLTKDKVRAHFNDLISSSYKKKLFPKGTSGSTGTPLIYLTTLEAKSYMWAGILLSWEVAGYEIGDKVAFVAGTSLIKNDFKHLIFHKILNIDSYSTYNLNDTNILNYIKKLQKTKAKIIYCYPTALDIMATYIHKNGPFAFPYLKGIISSAEVMTEANRANISSAFNVEVYNQYGCNEAGISAFECEYHRLHLINTRVIYEVDSNNNLLTTDLINDGFIMMKYFTGDCVEFSKEEKCACKRNFPIIKNVIGRSYDIVRDVNNNILHAAFFNILFRQDKSIKQFQIMFDTKTITIYLNVDVPFKDTAYYNKYLDVIKKHLYFNEYKLVINAPFLKSENAKHRYVINTAV